MADRQSISIDRAAALLAGSASAIDIARLSGLSFSAAIADVRTDQARREAARLMAEDGELPSAMVTEAAKVRAERATATRDLDERGRKDLAKELEAGGGDAEQEQIRKPRRLRHAPPGARGVLRRDGYDG